MSSFHLKTERRMATMSIQLEFQIHVPLQIEKKTEIKRQCLAVTVKPRLQICLYRIMTKTSCTGMKFT